MDRILLVRHGRANSDEDADPALSEVGVAQAQALAWRLRADDVRQLLHGPRRRAQQTAEILGEARQVHPRETDLLEDRTPHPSAARWDDYPRERWQWLQETPASERDEDAAELDAAWSRLGAPAGEGTLVAVTHAYVIGSFVRAVLGAPPSAWLQLPVANASVTELRSRPTGEWAVHSVSDVGHLLDRDGAP